MADLVLKSVFSSSVNARFLNRLIRDYSFITAPITGELILGYGVQRNHFRRFYKTSWTPTRT